MKTLQEKYAAGLLAAGYERVHTNSFKYQAYRRPGSKFIVWLGKSGSVRSGRISTDSHPVSVEFKRKLLALGGNPIQISLEDLGL